MTIGSPGSRGLSSANTGDASPACQQVTGARALHLRKTAYGPDHPEVAYTLGNLAVALRELGELAAARPLLERSLRIDEAAYGPDHPEVAGGLNNLAWVLRELGEPAAARPLLERALRRHQPAQPRLGAA